MRWPNNCGVSAGYYRCKENNACFVLYSTLCLSKNCSGKLSADKSVCLFWLDKSLQQDELEHFAIIIISIVLFFIILFI